MLTLKGRIKEKMKHPREIKGRQRKKEGNWGGATGTVIYGWSSRKVEACSQNDKWVSSDRVLY